MKEFYVVLLSADTNDFRPILEWTLEVCVLVNEAQVEQVYDIYNRKYILNARPGKRYMIFAIKHEPENPFAKQQTETLP